MDDLEMITDSDAALYVLELQAMEDAAWDMVQDHICDKSSHYLDAVSDLCLDTFIGDDYTALTRRQLDSVKKYLYKVEWERIKLDWFDYTE